MVRAFYRVLLPLFGCFCTGRERRVGCGVVTFAPLCAMLSIRLVACARYDYDAYGPFLTYHLLIFISMPTTYYISLCLYRLVRFSLTLFAFFAFSSCMLPRKPSTSLRYCSLFTFIVLVCSLLPHSAFFVICTTPASLGILFSVKTFLPASFHPFLVDF